MSAESEPSPSIPPSFALEGGTDGDDSDSAIQQVVRDVAAVGGTETDQKAIVGPLGREVRQHWQTLLREGTTVAFDESPRSASEFVIAHLCDRLQYADVPEDYRDGVQTAFEARLEEKKAALTAVFEEVVTRAERTVLSESESELTDWTTLEQ